MIHSMSGGVLEDGGLYRFAKVRLEGEARWYLAPFPVKEGDCVCVPHEGEAKRGTVERVETCSKATAPVSPTRAQAILSFFEAS